MLQDPPCPPPLRPGVLVRARGRLWRLVHLTPGAHCRALHLAPATSEGDDRLRARVLIEPFDRCLPQRAPSGARLVSRRAWVAHLARELTAETRLDVPGTAAAARIDLHAYQLEPVVRLLRGEAARVLLADAVGLGKTIEAGLVIAEVLARTPAARVLLVVPAGLREQWIGELRDRFHLEATRCDAAWLAAQSRALPSSTNPWAYASLPVVSIDFLKRPEVINGLDAFTWDLLVIDEAHTASAGSDRGAAVAALARRARRVVLASATPHDGDPQRFAALCATGALGRDDPLLVFRRSPASAGRAAATVARPLRVRVSPAHRRMHALLDAYAGAVQADAARGGHHSCEAGAALALTVLRKRALSSARALWLTALRRRALLAGTSDAGAGPAQPALPFSPAGPDLEGDGEAASAVLAAPGLAHPRREAAWLGALAEAAHLAARDEPKLAVLLRWLRRTREPVIVFTEYRDTLAVLAPALVRAGHTTAVLHGAQPDPERRAALDAFTSGRVGVLAATDTASEGLNLQARCRTVICFDVPWSPSRLAQRVGRVDRLGQARRVHALLLVAAGTGDEDLLARILTRTGRIEAALDAADPVAGAGGVQADDPTVFLHHLRRVLHRATALRAGAPHARPGAQTATPRGDASQRTAITTLRVRSGAWTAGDGLLWLVSVRLSPEPDTGAQDLERHLVPVFLPWRAGPSRANLTPEHPAWELLERHEREARACALASLAPRVEGVRRWVERRCATQRDRAEAIAADAAKRLAAALVQPGLFDRRGHETGTARTPAGALAPAAPPLSQGETAGLGVYAHVVAFARLVVRRSGSSHAEPVSR